MSPYNKPLPTIDENSRPFWQGLKERQVLVQRCGACGKLRFPAAPVCQACRSQDVSWVPVSGRGTVWSYTVFHKLYFPGFEADMPYGVAVVQLDEGIKLFTNIVGASNEEIRIGMPVESVFEDVTPEVTLLKFRPAGKRGGRP